MLSLGQIVNVQVGSHKSKLCLHFFYALWIQLIDIPISLSFAVDTELEPDLDMKEVCCKITL